MSEQNRNEAGNEGGSVTVALPEATEAVQKVAAAIFLANDHSLDQARAALRALRNPTDEMLGGRYGFQPRAFFTEMIDVLLGESP